MTRDDPPHDADAERAVLGAILRAAQDDPERAARLLGQAPDSGEYYRPHHETLATHLQKAAAAGDPLDPVAVLARITDHRDLKPGLLDGPYLADLVAAAAPEPSLPWHTDRIRRLARQRRAREVAGRMEQRLGTVPPEDADGIVWEGLADLEQVVTHMGAAVPPRRGWQPVNLDQVLDGTYVPPMPTVGKRDDGVGLFYPGRQHTVASDSEAGKTWYALHAAVTELDRGNAVVYVDFEDDEGGIVGRLLALQVRPDVIRDRFAYLHPESPVTDAVSRSDLAQALGDLRPTFAVIDGVTEAMVLHGLDPLSNRDAAVFGGMLPGWVAAHGPAVASLDHVTKSGDGRGRYALGAVHKLNGLNGGAYLLDSRRPFGIGLTGRSTVKIAKDRPGQLRRHGQPSSAGMHWFGDLVLDSQHETFLVASIETPTTRPDNWRPTHLMTKVAQTLADAAAPLSGQGVTDRVGGKATNARQALAFLVDDGHVQVENGPRGAKLHRLVKAYGDVTP